MGHNGDQTYRDSVASPFPAIRFKEDKTDYDIQLREKEKGDWHKMTIEEKKHLYRQSHCQTFQEMKHGNDGDWKSYLVAGSSWFPLLQPLISFTTLMCIHQCRRQLQNQSILTDLLKISLITKQSLTISH